LSITSTTLTSAQVSQTLALDPDSFHDAGEPVDRKRYPHGAKRCNALWSFDSRLPDSASLAKHLRGLIDVFDPRLEALKSLQGLCTQRFFCGLFGDREINATFEVPADVIRWCADTLEIALDCYPPCSPVDEEIGGSDKDEIDDAPREPDRALAYLGAEPVSLLWLDESSGFLDEQILPRPAMGDIVAISDLPETTEALDHLMRVMEGFPNLGASRREKLELSCLFTTERGAGSIVCLNLPILKLMAQVGIRFRIVLYQSPSALRRLQRAH
jgi:hypothetical protein